MTTYPDDRKVDDLTIEQLRQRIAVLENGSEPARTRALAFIRQHHYFGVESKGPEYITAIAKLIDELWTETQ